MIDPTTVSNEEIERRYEALPDDVLEAFEGADTSRRIFEIARAEGIAIDKIGEIARAVGYILLGIMPSSDLPEALAGVLDDREKSKKIALAISEKIFLPIRESMKKAEGEKVREYLYAGGRAKEPAGARTPEIKTGVSVPSLTRISTPPPLTESAAEPETGEFAKRPEPLIINPLSPRRSYVEEPGEGFIESKLPESGITKPLETARLSNYKEPPKEVKKETVIPKTEEEARPTASPREINPFKPAIMKNENLESIAAKAFEKEKAIELEKTITSEKTSPSGKTALPEKITPAAGVVMPPGYESIKKEFEKEFRAFAESKAPEKPAADGEKATPAEAATPPFTVTKEKILAEIERARAGLKSDAPKPEPPRFEVKMPLAPDKVAVSASPPPPIPEKNATMSPPPTDAAAKVEGKMPPAGPPKPPAVSFPAPAPDKMPGKPAEADKYAADPYREPIE